jgi:hypothetical protein
MKVEAHHLIHLLKWPPKVTQAFNQTHTCGTEMGDLGCIAVIPPQAFYLSTGVREVHSAGNIKSKRFAKKKKIVTVTLLWTHSEVNVSKSGDFYPLCDSHLLCTTAS